MRWFTAPICVCECLIRRCYAGGVRLFCVGVQPQVSSSPWALVSHCRLDLYVWASCLPEAGMSHDLADPIGFLWRSLFVNRPAASARQFNSAQTGAAVSVTTWMLSSSREMRKETLQACMLAFKHHQLGCVMVRNTGCRAQLNLRYKYEIPCNLIPFYSSNQYRYQWKPVGMIRPGAITQMHEFIEIYNTFLTSFPCSM